VGAVPGTTCPCCIKPGSVPLSFFLLRRMKKIPNATAAMTANPPIVPPTIGPTGVGLEFGVVIDAGKEEELSDIEDPGGVEEFGDVELGVGEGDTYETVCGLIAIVININEADNFPPLVAVAYIVPTDGVESQYQTVAGKFPSPITTSWLQKGKKVPLNFIST